MQYLFEQMRDVYLEHDCDLDEKCNFSDFYIDKFTDEALKSKFIFRCSKCGFQSSINCELTDENKMSITDRAVLAALAAGTVHSRLELILGSIFSFNFYIITLNLNLNYVLYFI